MRKIIVGAMTSLDGVMQAPGGPSEDPTGGFKFGGWVAPHFDDQIGEVIGQMFARPFDLLLGRKTYEIFAAHWPYAPEDDPIGLVFNRVTKYVATHNRDFQFDWQNSQGLGSDAVARLKELKLEDGPDLLTQGSTEFLKTLFAHGLVDELNITTFPVILGKGKRLFGEGSHPSGLKLTSSRTTPAGIVVTKYVPAGEVKVGDFSYENPSQAEVDRRKTLT